MSENILNVNDLDFEKEVLKADVPVLVDFWAAWCSPCRMQAPILNELASEIVGKAKICKVNVDEAESLAIKYGINSIPTLLVFKNSAIVEKSVGLTSKGELSAMLIKHV